MSIEATKRLYEIGMGKVEGASIAYQVRCLVTIIERGCGKPVQPISGEDGSPVQIVIHAKALGV
jgi:hypothetical protein